MQTLQANVKKTLFRKTDFAVLRVSTYAGESFVASGRMPEFFDGQVIEISGDWEDHTTYGRQFSVKAAAEVSASTSQSIEAFLIARCKGCGPAKAKAIVDHFGEDLRDVLDNSPWRLTEVKKVNAKQAQIIQDAWKKTDAQEKSLTLFLSTIGIQPNWAYKIGHRLGVNAISIIKKNPYRLADVFGIGFMTADEVAQRMGWSLNSPERAFAICLFLLTEYCQEGHTYIVQDEFIERMKAQKIDKDLALQAISSHVQNHTLVEQKSNFSSCIYLPKLFDAENRLSRALAKILKANIKSVHDPVLDAMILDSEQEMGITLTAKQREAVQGTFRFPISILTGRPGTGKTKCVQMVVRIAQKLHWKLSLAAPTGRASKNMNLASGAEATTIHRLLEYKQMGKKGEFLRNSGNPLECNLLTLDEVSMMDVELADQVFQAVRPGTHVLLIGDPDQLPSVGPGRVLLDLIRSNLIPTTELDQIHRQAAESMIVTNSHRVLDGKMPMFPPPDPQGQLVPETFMFEPPKNLSRPAERAEWVKKTLITVLTKSLPKRLEFNAIKDVQVLIPMKAGEIGVNSFNLALQEALNPIPAGDKDYEREFAFNKFRLNDRIQVMKNLYDLNVFNGDIGIVKSFDNTKEEICIHFDDEVVYFPYKEANKLSLAYAITIHRSQGSEYPITFVVMSTQHTIMLQRNLLYTAQTRPRKHLFFFGEQRAIEIAVNNNTIQNRNSLLGVRLKQLCSVH